MMKELNFARRRKLPVVRGAEAAECGLVCLTMVARYWGHKLDLNGLRQRFSLSLSGATLKSMMDQADQLGFTTRALRVDLELLHKVQLPAIIHWSMNHFVVLKKVGSNKYHIHDPSGGAREIQRQEFSKQFTGVVLELSPSKSFQVKEAMRTTKIQDLWSEMDGFWSALVHVLALTVFLQILVFLAPFQMQLTIDEAIGRNDRALLPVLAIGFGGLAIIQAAIELMRAWTLSAVGGMLSFQMVSNVVRHVIRLPVYWFEKRHVGDILSRIRSTGPIQELITQGAVSALIDGGMAIIILAILFFYSPLLSLVVLGGVFLNLLAALAFYPAMKLRMEEQITTAAVEQSHLMETIRAATTIKLLGGEAERESAWRNLYADYVNAGFSVGKFQMGQNFAQSLINGLQTVVLLYLAANIILSGQGFSIGMLYAFLSFKSTFTDRISGLIDQFLNLRLVTLHLDRLSDIVHAEKTVTATQSVVFSKPGDIKFENVTFKYGAADKLIFDKVNFHITDGSFVAITGASGAGKSTLCKLLVGMYPPTFGEVLIDGRQATDSIWPEWRKVIGLVAQDDRLLSGSIAENIAFFDPELEMTAIQLAARAACIHNDIMKMPMQYLSLVGDMGSALSGGQRQRILIARALYRQPKVLILDEGTANLDADTEGLLADMISSLPITRIIIAHRPLLVQRAERVFEVEDCSIVERSNRLLAAK